MQQPMTPQEIKAFSGSAWFLVDHSNPDNKRILEDSGGETLLFKTEVDANDYAMETNCRRSNHIQAVKELF